MKKAFLAAIVAAIVGGSVAYADTVDVDVAGYGWQYTAADGSELKYGLGALPVSFGLVSAGGGFSSPTTAGTVAPSYGIGATYLSVSDTPDGGLGAGTLTLQWRGRRYGAAKDAQTAVIVEVVDFGQLDGGDMTEPGVEVGRIGEFPEGKLEVGIPVDFDGFDPAGALSLRVRTESDGNLGGTYQARVDGPVTLDVEVTEPAASEADALIERLAALLGIDAQQLAAALAMMGGQ